MGGGGFILVSSGCWWVYLGWWRMAVSSGGCFCMVVSGGG